MRGKHEEESGSQTKEDASTEGLLRNCFYETVPRLLTTFLPPYTHSHLFEKSVGQKKPAVACKNCKHTETKKHATYSLTQAGCPASLEQLISSSFFSRTQRRGAQARPWCAPRARYWWRTPRTPSARLTPADLRTAASHVRCPSFR